VPQKLANVFQNFSFQMHGWIFAQFWVVFCKKNVNSSLVVTRLVLHVSSIDFTQHLKQPRHKTNTQKLDIHDKINSQRLSNYQKINSDKLNVYFHCPNFITAQKGHAPSEHRLISLSVANEFVMHGQYNTRPTITFPEHQYQIIPFATEACRYEEPG